MNGFSIPLEIVSGRLKQEDSLKNSIDRNIDLIMTTKLYSSVVDPEFGFVFNNLRFEVVSEQSGVIFCGDKGEKNPDMIYLYSKKVSGSSKNEDTFANALKLAIERNDKRLSDVRVTMTYMREEKTIYVSVKGMIVEGNVPYQYNTSMKVWS